MKTAAGQRKSPYLSVGAIVPELSGRFRVGPITPHSKDHYILWRLCRAMSFSSPPDVGATYETFKRVQLRRIAAGMGITYEQLTGDLTGVNYSSIRAGLLEFRRRCEQFQHQVIVFQMCRPIWQAWIDAAVLNGALPKAQELAPYYNVKWISPGFAWADPLKDIKAQIMAVRAGFRSRAEVVSEQGYDAEGIDREIAADNARADSLGLEYDSDPRKEPNAPATASGDANL